jgi:nucleoid-associated protein YgaU
MWKAVCLALGCLLGMSAVLALAPAGDRILSDATAALPSTSMSTRAVEEADEALVVNTSSKADRLLSAVSDEAALTRVPVETIKLAPTSDKNPPAKPAPKAREVTSWHWHVGSKIKRN